MLIFSLTHCLKHIMMKVNNKAKDQLLKQKNKKTIKVQTAKNINHLNLLKLKSQPSIMKKTKLEMFKVLNQQTRTFHCLQKAKTMMKKMQTTNKMQSTKKIWLKSFKIMLNSRPRWKENKKRKIKRNKRIFKKKINLI